MKCPGHSDGRHVLDVDGTCMGEGCNMRFQPSTLDPLPRMFVEGINIVRLKLALSLTGVEVKEPISEVRDYVNILTARIVNKKTADNLALDQALESMSEMTEGISQGLESIRTLRAQIDSLTSDALADIVKDWDLRQVDSWIYYLRPDGFRQAVCPNDPHPEHSKSLYLLMQAILKKTGKEPEVSNGLAD